MPLRYVIGGSRKDEVEVEMGAGMGVRQRTGSLIYPDVPQISRSLKVILCYVSDVAIAR